MKNKNKILCIRLWIFLKKPR